jgi:hypothetical protein
MIQKDNKIDSTWVSAIPVTVSQIHTYGHDTISGNDSLFTFLRMSRKLGLHGGSMLVCIGKGCSES